MKDFPRRERAFFLVQDQIGYLVPVEVSAHIGSRASRVVAAIYRAYNFDPTIIANKRWRSLFYSKGCTPMVRRGISKYPLQFPENNKACQLEQ